MPVSIYIQSDICVWEVHLISLSLKQKPLNMSHEMLGWNSIHVFLLHEDSFKNDDQRAYIRIHR